MSFFHGFTDELCKLAEQSAADWIASAVPKKKAVPPPAAPTPGKQKVQLKPKPVSAPKAPEMKMRQIQAGSAEAKRIMQKAKTMGKVESAGERDRRLSRERYERNRRIMQQQREF